MANLAETLYYQTYSSVLLGNMQNAKMYLTFLREEYEENRQQFEELKKDHRWEHLKELGNVIDKDYSYSRNLSRIDKPDGFMSGREEEETVYEKQDDLVNAIINCQDDLRMCLLANSDFHCCCVEKQTRFGRVDLVAQDHETIYPIEVKKNGAYHDCVGQVDKYITHFKLGLINKIYQHVVGVVIANTFHEYVLQELHKFGAIAVKYKFKSEKVVEFTRL